MLARIGIMRAEPALRPAAQPEGQRAALGTSEAEERLRKEAASISGPQRSSTLRA
jgi:hypothetical protein